MKKLAPFGIINDNGRYFAEEDRSSVDAISLQISQALERARLLEQTQKTAIELQTVSKVSSAASTLLDPSHLLQSIVDLTKSSFNLYHAHIYLLDHDLHKLVLTAGAGEIGKSMVAEGWTILLDEPSIVAGVANSRQGRIVNNVHDVQNFLPNPLLPNTSSELAVPMGVGNQLVGVFDVQSDRQNDFTEAAVSTRPLSPLLRRTGVRG